MKQALVVGATGLVGRHVVKELINSEQYQEIHLLTRRRTVFSENPIVTEHLLHFDDLEGKKPLFEKVDEVFIALGTTMKEAQSQEKFIKVDFTYPLRIAELATECEVAKLFVVTAMGANRDSAFFYSRVKGKLEDRLILLNHPSLHILRPSLLIGERFEFRAGEKTAEWIARPLSFFLTGQLEKYKPVKGTTVAAVMREVAQIESYGTHIYESDLLSRLGEVLGR